MNSEANVMVGRLPVSPDAKATGLLADVQVDAPQKAIVKTKLYRLGIKRELGFELQLRVGGHTFCTETFGWEGSGDQAKQRYRRGALARLTDEDVQRIKDDLKFRYLRPNVHKTGGVLGYSDVEASDGGSYDPATNVRTPPKLLASRLRGDEIPLAPHLILEPLEQGYREGEDRVVTAEDMEKAKREEEADEANTLKPDAFETGRGGRKRDAKLLKELSTVTEKTSKGGAAAGLIG